MQNDFVSSGVQPDRWHAKAFYQEQSVLFPYVESIPQYTPHGNYSEITKHACRTDVIAKHPSQPAHPTQLLAVVMLEVGDSVRTPVHRLALHRLGPSCAPEISSPHQAQGLGRRCLIGGYRGQGTTLFEEINCDFLQADFWEVSEVSFVRVQACDPA